MEKKIQVTEDQALGQNVPLADLVKAKEDEGYVVTSMHGHPAVGTVVSMTHRNYMDKPLSHRDFFEKGRRGL